MKRLALRCYPPAWRERYGAELEELSEGQDGVTLDLLVGAARAWTQPPAGRTTADRRRSAVSTAHVSWCLTVLAVIGYVKQVDDPPLPGLTTGLSQPLWGAEKAAFFAGSAVLLLTGTALLLRVAVPAVRRRDWFVLRPMLPATALLVVVLATIPLVAHFGPRTPDLGAVLVVLTWLGLGLALMVAGAIGPVVALRRSGLTMTGLPLVAAGVVTAMAVLLALASMAQAAVLSDQATPALLVPMWGAVAMMTVAAATSTTSLRRALS